MQPDPQIFYGLGYDHCFLLGGDSPAVTVLDRSSGRVLEIHTDQPGVQVYTGNKLCGAFAGHGGSSTANQQDWRWSPRGFPTRRITRTSRPLF